MNICDAAGAEESPAQHWDEGGQRPGFSRPESGGSTSSFSAPGWGLSLCRAKPFEGLTILGGGGWGCRTASAADMSDQRWAQRASADRGPEESVVGTWRPARHSGSPVLSRPVSLSVSPLCPGPVSFSRQLAMRCSMRSLGSAPQGAYNTGNIFVDRVHLKKLKAAKIEAL